MNGMYKRLKTNAGDTKACTATFELAAPKNIAGDVESPTVQRMEAMTFDAPTVKKMGTNPHNKPATNPDDAMRVQAYREMKDAGCDFSGTAKPPVTHGPTIAP